MRKKKREVLVNLGLGTSLRDKFLLFYSTYASIGKLKRDSKKLGNVLESLAATF